MLVAQSCLDTLRPHGLWPARLLCPWDFPGQRYWRGLPFLPGDLPDSGIKPECLLSPALAGGFFITSTTWEAFPSIYLSFTYPSTHASISITIIEHLLHVPGSIVGTGNLDMNWTWSLRGTPEMGRQSKACSELGTSQEVAW